jgi:hypothetical protein
MKKLILALLLTSTLSASAAIIGDTSGNPCDGGGRDAVVCTFGLTFSLPTIIVADKKIKLSEKQTVLTIISEMDGETQFITAAFAEANGMSIEEAQELALVKYDN